MTDKQTEWIEFDPNDPRVQKIKSRKQDKSWDDGCLFVCLGIFFIVIIVANLGI